MKNLDDIRILKTANDIGNEIWDIVSIWDYFLKDTIGKQMTRSVDSIGANIAEGFGRFHYKENRRFCYFSRGSLLETIVWLGKCKDRNIIPEDQASRLIKSLYDLNHKLNLYIYAIGKNQTDKY